MRRAYRSIAGDCEVSANDFGNGGRHSCKSAMVINPHAELSLWIAAKLCEPIAEILQACGCCALLCTCNLRTALAEDPAESRCSRL